MSDYSLLWVETIRITNRAILVHVLGMRLHVWIPRSLVSKHPKSGHRGYLRVASWVAKKENLTNHGYLKQDPVTPRDTSTQTGGDAEKAIHPGGSR
jgi:hypothetical protein